MKKIIRWLADVSGVTLQIQIEERKYIGGSMWQDAYWWNGGIQFHREKTYWPVWNAFFLYAKPLREGGYPNIQTIREDVYKFDQTPIEPGSVPLKPLQ